MRNHLMATCFSCKRNHVSQASAVYVPDPNHNAKVWYGAMKGYRVYGATCAKRAEAAGEITWDATSGYRVA